jgi:hypothetical protein
MIHLPHKCEFSPLICMLFLYNSHFIIWFIYQENMVCEVL